ncbi:MAG: MarR family winged helix-turn-helix transcriptional regulator [Candidatus Caenarcaniphilales bacterium]|nr:MarR family winged helix-turn-helix transcriptional regulator [Candidatus Caenarcaniphilales bacterium]
MELNKKILSAFERINTAMRFSLQKSGNLRNVSPLQAQILFYLLTNKQTSTSKIAEHLCVSKPTISDAVASIMKKKLIKKMDSNDGRSYKVALTNKGIEEVKILSSFETSFLESINKLSDQQKHSTWEALLRLLKSMQEQGLIPMNKMCFTCNHFAQDTFGEKYYCNLMNSKLEDQNLRLNCEEHEST